MRVSFPVPYCLAMPGKCKSRREDLGEVRRRGCSQGAAGPAAVHQASVPRGTVRPKPAWLWGAPHSHGATVLPGFNNTRDLEMFMYFLFSVLRAEVTEGCWSGTSTLLWNQTIYRLCRYYFRSVGNRTLKQRAPVRLLCREKSVHL